MKDTNNIKINNEYNNEKLMLAISSVKDIRMTSREKEAILERIIKTAPIKSPWTIYSFGIWIRKNQWSRAITLVLAISLAGSSLTLAANGSIPGDPLYPIKINVTEPIRAVFAFSAQAKAALAASLANERMREGQILATEGKLDEPKQIILSNLIQAHTQTLNTNLAIVASSDPKEAADISSHFQAQMERYANNLKALAGVIASTTDGITMKTAAKTEVAHTMKRIQRLVSTSAISTSTSTSTTMTPATTTATAQNNDHSADIEGLQQSTETHKNNRTPIDKLVDSAQKSEEAISNSTGSNWNKSYPSYQAKSEKIKSNPSRLNGGDH